MKNKGFKDFLYNTNDIWLAAAILIIAALLIVWRVNVIMAYPKTLDKVSGTTTTEQKSASTAASDSKAKADNKSNASLYKDGKLTEAVKVKVAGGSESAAINSLVKAKLFTSDSDFKKACKAADVKPSKIKAGTFTFKKGSTKESIAKQVTK